MDKQILEHSLGINRRKFLSKLSLGIGSVALGSLLIPAERTPSICTQSKKDHLSFSERGTFPIGFV
jgi:hypothetical protein